MFSIRFSYFVDGQVVLFSMQLLRLLSLGSTVGADRVVYSIGWPMRANITSRDSG